MNAYAQTAERPPLERAVILAQRFFPAKTQGKPATIKDADGISYGIWPDKAGIVQEGGRYEISFAKNVTGGVTYRNIQNIRAAEGPGPAPEQFTGGQQQNAARQPASPPPAHQAQPQGSGNGGGNYYRPTSPRDSERMFVCSTLNAYIQTGRVDPHRDHIAAIIIELRAAYAKTFGHEDQ